MLNMLYGSKEADLLESRKSSQDLLSPIPIKSSTSSMPSPRSSIYIIRSALKSQRLELQNDRSHDYDNV